MAPRPPDDLRRIAACLRAGETSQRFSQRGGELSHAVQLEADGRWRVRRLALDEACVAQAKARAQAAGGSFMPEHVEHCRVPGPVVVFEAETLEAMCAALEDGSWIPKGRGPRGSA